MMNDKQTINCWVRIGNGIVFKVNNVGKHDDVVRAIETLLRRLVDSGSTLKLLFDSGSQHDWTADGACILRVCYDAMLQALYILADPKQQQQRARRFLDFSVIEQVKMIRLIDAGRTKASKRIAKSSRRAATEPKINREFARVCKLYGYDEKKLSVNWFKGSLRDVAKEAGFETEYEILHKQLSGTIHSSMFGLSSGEAFKGFNGLQLYWLFAFRVLSKFADYVGAVLSVHEQKILKLADRNVLDGHT